MLLAVVVVDLIGFAIVVPILPFYAVQYGAGGLEVGAIVASFALFQFAFGPVWGRLSDRVGRRPVLLATIAGNTVALAALGFADSLATILAARVLAGAFSGNVGVATAYITDVTADEDRPRWMGLIGLSFAIGFTLGPAIGGVASKAGYAAPMFVAAALSAVNLVQAWMRLPESPEHARRAGDAAPALSRIDALRQPGVALLTSTNFAFAFAVTQLETVFQLYMLDRFGWDAFAVSMILFGMAIVMGGVQGGAIRTLSARFGERTLIRTGAVVLAAGFVATPAAPTVVWLLVPLGLAAVGRALLQPSLMTLASFRTAEHTRGAVMGTYQSAAALARVVGPLVAGHAYDVARPAPFAIAAAATAVVFALATSLPAPPLEDVAHPDAGV
ncbi:MAG: MFS transporter [Myxococcales bacterium]|nr:MFS transporter [Myxococcales bacterium]